MSHSEELTAATLLEQEKKAMEHCEKALLCDVEFIQGCGYLLAYDPENEIITHVSENISSLESRTAADYLGSKLDQFFSSEICHQCRNTAGHSTISTQRESIGRVLYEPDLALDIFAHMKNDRMMLEFQPVHNSVSNRTQVLNTIQCQIERLGKISTTKELLDQTCKFFRAVSRFQRVKAYSFLPDGSGEIIAESKEPQMDSFIGLRFPEQDIPQAARVLYATTPIRIIPSVPGENSKIYRLQSEQPLDLSLAILRGIVPVHMLYLQNMSVKASVTVPIVVEGSLWGLFAFHNMDELMLDTDTLLTLEIVGNAVSMMLDVMIQKERFESMSRCTKVATALFSPNENALGFSSDWGAAAPELSQLISCSGISLVGSERSDTYGVCPSLDAIEELANRLDQHLKQSQYQSIVIETDCVSARYPRLNLGAIVGFLAIPSPFPSYRYLIFYRQSASASVKWAGSPQKKLVEEDGQFRLHPRASFQAYIDSSDTRSDPFNSHETIIAESIFNAFERNAASLLRHKAKRDRMGLMVRELNHRVRNVLALVRSIATLSSQGHHDVNDFITFFERRIQSLAEAHSLLTKSDWEPVSARSLFKRALQPFIEYGEDRILLRGPETTIDAALASLLALVICELASNAVKYGAWSSLDGIVELKWKADQDILTIHWQEMNGPVVVPPTRKGFGSSIIKDALAHEFKATSLV